MKFRIRHLGYEMLYPVDAGTSLQKNYWNQMIDENNIVYKKNQKIRELQSEITQLNREIDEICKQHEYTLTELIKVEEREGE